MAYTEHPRHKIEELIRRAQASANDPMLGHLSHDRIYVSIAEGVMHFAHSGQFLKSGERYDTHTRHVGKQMENLLDRQAGYLHDVLENSNITLEDLRAKGFKEEVLEAVDALTKKIDPVTGKQELSLDNLQRLSRNAIASRVKKVDYKHNNDPNRQPEIMSKNREEKRAMRRMVYTIGIPFLDFVDTFRNDPDPKISAMMAAGEITLGFFMARSEFLKTMTKEQMILLEKTIHENSTDRDLLEWFKLAVELYKTTDQTNPSPSQDDPFPHCA